MSTGPLSARRAPVLVYSLVAASLLSGSVTLLLPGLLTGPPVMNGSAKGTALVIVLGGAPLLALAYRRARRGSLPALAVATGAAAYLLYNAVLLVFATPFNRAFLLYEAMLGLALWTVAVMARELWVEAEHLTVPASRWAAAFVLGVVVLNVAAWLGRLVPSLLSDEPRSILAGTGLTTNPIYVQDLAFWLPCLAWIAVGLWTAHAPRTVLGAAALCYWVLEAAGVAVDQWWGHQADPTSSVASLMAVPLFVVVGAMTVWPLVEILKVVARATRVDHSTDGPWSSRPMTVVDPIR
jgi:hypothetical protein